MFIEFEKRVRRRTAAADEIDLPEAIIQIVQSFLTAKEAARTTILSKSWGSAWLTRPNLDFDHEDFSEYSDQFLEFAEKTLERCENLNLSIHSFKLSMKHRSDIASNLLVCRALKLGPTHLTFQFKDFQYNFYIPGEVFRYESLVSLTAKGCRINLNPDGRVCCSRLQFLSLEHAMIECRDTIFHILMKSCPLIEKLSLRFVRYVGDSNLLQQSTINLLRLKSLVLEDVNFDVRLLADLSFIFPSLKDLTLSIISKDREDQMLIISSTTLERLDLNWQNHRVKLDIPSIRKLTFSCSSIPKLSVRSNSRGWKSHISIERRKCLSVSWFYKLSKLLNKLRLSRISLSLRVSSQVTFDYEPGDIKGLPKPEIENLNIYHMCLPSLSCYVLFDGLFRMCRPKVITQYTSDENWDTNTIRFLGKRLLEARDAKFPIPNYQFMYGLNDLKEARAQVFDAAVSTWRDVTLESLLETLETLAPLNSEEEEEDYHYLLHRFQLTWKQ